MEKELQSFTMTNLARQVCKVIRMPHKRVFQELKQFVQPRLDYLNGIKRKIKIYFWFEESYVETEWKDMVAQHYLNTSYHVDNTVMRIHLVGTEYLSQVDASNYAGCFTLRHIDEVRIMLSFIYPNWEVVWFGNEVPCVMTYLKQIHINGKEIAYHTYPLFVQDDALLGCAQACLISMSKYLNQKYDYNRIVVDNISKAIHYQKEKLIPTRGLIPAQMLEILDYHHIPVRFKVFAEDSDVDDFMRTINYTIESALPVLLGTTVRDEKEGIKRHAIQIIGHAGEGTERKYIVYDDSGFYLKSLGEDNPGFVEAISEEQLKEALKSEKSCIVYPVHERAYLLYDNIKNRLKNIFNKIPVLKELERRGVCNVEGARCFLADNREVKAFLVENLRRNISVQEREEIKRIVEMDMPHYLWFCEVEANVKKFTKYIIFLADPTFNQRTTKNIFINDMLLIFEKQFGLLHYGTIRDTA